MSLSSNDVQSAQLLNISTRNPNKGKLAKCCLKQVYKEDMKMTILHISTTHHGYQRYYMYTRIPLWHDPTWHVFKCNKRSTCIRFWPWKKHTIICRPWRVAGLFIGMACLLVCTEPLSEPMLEYFYWTLGNKFQWNYNRNSTLFIHETEFDNVVCKMESISSGNKCVDGLIINYQYEPIWSRHGLAQAIEISTHLQLRRGEKYDSNIFNI